MDCYRAILSSPTLSRPTLMLRNEPHLVSTNSLGLLVLVIAVLGLHLLDLGHVPLLRLLRRDALLDDRLPGVVFGLALFVGVNVSRLSAMFDKAGERERQKGRGKVQLALRSNMPGWVAAVKSSPVATL